MKFTALLLFAFATSAFANEYSAPSIVLCKNKTHDLHVFNVDSGPGEISGENEDNLVTLKDSRGQVLEERLMVPFYWPKKKSHLYFLAGESDDRIEKITLKLSALTYTKKDGTKITFKRCKVVQVQPGIYK